jgi:thiol:disulfide interchange protein DsbD
MTSQGNIMPGQDLRKECRLIASALAALVAGAGLFWSAGALAQQTDPFAPGNAAGQKTEIDPFAKENALPEAPSERARDTQEPKGAARNSGRIGPPTPVDERIDFGIALTPEVARRGEKIKLTITGTPRPGFHTYPIGARTPDQPALQLSKLEFENYPVLKPVGPVTESAWEVEDFAGIGLLFIHNKPFTWTQDILVLPDARPGKLPLRFFIDLQACDDQTCVKGKPEFEVLVDVSGAPPLTPSPADLEGATTGIQVITPPESPPSGSGEQGGLATLLLFSMGSAVVMLFTPCVFPMIPITVSFFLKQSEKEHHNALLSAAVYSLTIIVVLAAAVLVLGSVIIKLANSAWVNLAIGAMLLFFALSLFGMYEIELPAGLARFTSAREGKRGYLGTVFMALTFTVTSFTCTGPFLGPILAATKEMQLGTARLVIAALAYSATFAAPFFVLALFPRLLRSLPKSGGWLNSVKVVMGFVELALALKFLANADIAWNPGSPKFFNYETVLVAWIVLSVGCGLYLFGLFRLPHDSPVESLGVVRMILATMFFGLALYMMPALFRVTPQGLVGRILVALLPWDDKSVEKELTWSRDFEAAWQEALTKDKLIFIDFTGVNCTNCRANEKNVFVLPQVKRELAQFVRVQLYTDTVPDQALSSVEAARQADRNGNWQRSTFGDVSNPFYAIIRPVRGQPAILDGKLNGAVPGWTRKGRIDDDQIADFEHFLSAPQRATAAQNIGPDRKTAAVTARAPLD